MTYYLMKENGGGQTIARKEIIRRTGCKKIWKAIDNIELIFFVLIHNNCFIFKHFLLKYLAFAGSK